MKGRDDMPEVWNPDGPNGTITATAKVVSRKPHRRHYWVTMPSGREMPGAHDTASLLEYARYHGFRVEVRDAAAA